MIYKIIAQQRPSCDSGYLWEEVENLSDVLHALGELTQQECLSLVGVVWHDLFFGK